MSASSRPTERPVAARAQARFTATVDLPTPPLPLATAITRRTCASRSRRRHGRPAAPAGRRQHARPC